ncbi:MAG TPA: hypothetical protein VEQ11_13875 [Chloroflexota bacterium]|nr:hypothetical protein [Chloroflexota bacterium]
MANLAARRPRKAVWLARLAVLPLLGLLLPLLALEGALRAFGPFLPGQYQLGVLMVPDPEYGHFHLPGASVWYHSSEFVAHVRTNRYGLRGPELVEPRPPRLGRILVAGDSFVEARQMPEEATAVAVLAAALDAPGPARSSARSPESSSCEVVNGGVAGWGTGEEYVFLRQAGVHLQPDLVVLVFFLGNDVSNNVRREDPSGGWHRGPGFRLEQDGTLQELAFTLGPDEPPLAKSLRSRSLAYTYLDSGVLGKLDEDDTEGRQPSIGKQDLFAPRESADVRRAWRLTEALLGAIEQAIERAGSRLLLVAAPTSYQVYREEWARTVRSAAARESFDPLVPNRRLAQAAERLGVPLLDLLPAFQAAASSSERLYFRQDAHWTTAGNRLAASELASFLGQHPALMPPGCGAL